MVVKKLIISCWLFVLLVATVNAQSAFSSTGGSFSEPGGSVSYTVGIVSYKTLSDAAGSVVQGVQQPYEISVLTGLELPRDIRLDISAYPNPARETLYLKTSNSFASNMEYQLYHINGSIIERNKITKDITILDVEKLIPATYFLKIIEKNTEIKTFKIIKN
jgi:hypothetical protein